MIISSDSERNLAGLVVPRIGKLVEQVDVPGEPYRLVDAVGVVVEPVGVFFRELLASGRSTATVRSYGMDLLRWWRFLAAVNVTSTQDYYGHRQVTRSHTRTTPKC